MAFSLKKYQEETESFSVKLGDQELTGYYKPHYLTSKMFSATERKPRYVEVPVFDEEGNELRKETVAHYSGVDVYNSQVEQTLFMLASLEIDEGSGVKLVAKESEMRKILEGLDRDDLLKIQDAIQKKISDFLEKTGTDSSVG
jgi:hypothetical protein